MMSKSLSKFETNDRVFVDHKILFYEAKVLEYLGNVKGEPSYKVHYQGWNARYDETVPEVKIILYDNVSVKRAKELDERNNPSRSSVKKPKRAIPPSLKRKDPTEKSSSRASTPSLDDKQKAGSSTETGSNVASEPDYKKQRRIVYSNRIDPYNVESENQFVSRPEVKVKIPDELKPFLVDDWDMVTRQYKLVILPARKSVQQILAEYLSNKSESGCSSVVVTYGNKTGGSGSSSSKPGQMNESVAGIGDYFNVMLGSQLLYKFERPQYAEWYQKQKSDIKPETYYGAIHLLRLFVRLGYMLAYTSLSERNITIVLSHVHDFLSYLAKEKNNLFSPNDYMTAEPEYQRTAFI